MKSALFLILFSAYSCATTRPMPEQLQPSEVQFLTGGPLAFHKKGESGFFCYREGMAPDEIESEKLICVDFKELWDAKMAGEKKGREDL